MRRQFITKEESRIPPRFTAPERAAPAAMSASPQSSSALREHKKAATRTHPDRSRALRTLILVTGSLGVFGILVPLATGIPLSEWMKGVNIKEAYSGTNFHYMRGSTALKLGSLSGATDALLNLPPKSKEASEIASLLFPRLLAAKDYDLAARVAEHMGNTEGSGYAGQLWSHLIVVEGWEKALAIRTQLPSVQTIRSRMTMTSLLGTYVDYPVDFATLEKYLPQLNDGEQQTVIRALATHAIEEKRFEEAWRWMARLSPMNRSGMDALVARDQKEALRFLSTLDYSAASDSLRVDALKPLTKHAPQLAMSLLGAIKSPLQQEIAKILQNPDSLESLKAMGKLGEMVSSTDAVQEVLPRLAVIQSRDYENLQAPYNEILRRWIRTTKDPVLQEACLSGITEPNAKALAQQELAAARHRAR